MISPYIDGPFCAHCGDAKRDGLLFAKHYMDRTISVRYECSVCRKWSAHVNTDGWKAVPVMAPSVATARSGPYNLKKSEYAGSLLHWRRVFPPRMDGKNDSMMYQFAWIQKKYIRKIPKIHGINQKTIETILILTMNTMQWLVILY